MRRAKRPRTRKTLETSSAEQRLPLQQLDIKPLFKRLMVSKQGRWQAARQCQNGSSGGTQTANGGASPPSPAEAHRLWLQKRKYERHQGHIMASDSAETSDISKGGAALAARSAAGGIMGTWALMVRMWVAV
jgi:hypothetical protein